jgi:phosphoribulokinase
MCAGYFTPGQELPEAHDVLEMEPRHGLVLRFLGHGYDLHREHSRAATAQN